MTNPHGACPDAGQWRAWLDHESPGAQLEAHLETCPGCRELVADVRRCAQVAHDALGLLAPDHLPSSAETAVARERLNWRQRSAGAGTGTRLPAARRASAALPSLVLRMSTAGRIAASSAAAAVALSLVVALTPGGQAAASQFLAQFRSQQVTALEITPQSQADITRTMQTLSSLGSLQTPSGPAASPRELARSEREPAPVSLQQASQQVGFALLTPDPKTLPAGLGPVPTVRVMPATTLRFTFDKKKAQAYFQANGHPEVNVPDKFDGATLVVQIPAAAMLQYGTPSARDALVVGEAGELVVDAQGKVSLDEFRDFLLGLPGLPSATVAQLRQINNWNETLPIPVPVDRVHWQPAQFHGGRGLLLNDNSGVGSAAIWQSGGHLFGVAGSIKADQLKVVADSLAVHQ